MTITQIVRALAFSLILWMLILGVLVKVADADDPRPVDFGPWTAIVRCESGGNSLAQNPYSSANGAFQFLQSTWDGIARQRGQDQLVGKRPGTFTLATQLRQAEYLRRTVNISQWVCRGYGSGIDPITVTNERHSKKPKWCVKNLRNRWGFSRTVARSVCGR